MHQEYAAHVGHGIFHTSEFARIGLGLVGVAIAVSLVATGGGVLVIAGAAGLGGGLGMDVGSIVDKFVIPKQMNERIEKGFHSVGLGPDRKQAARAFSDCTGDKHHQAMGEGSELVALGKERAPMSRRQDRTSCGGVIGEALLTVRVGGEPSAKGKEFEEKDSATVKWMGITFTLLQAGAAAGKKEIFSAATGFLGAGLDATDNSAAASVVKGAGNIKPITGNFYETADQVLSLGKGVGGGVDLATKP